MLKQLPARPNLDHLRRQAKRLLTALDARDPNAVATILNHLPAARRMTAEQILATRFRLADAQSAIARESGFASWPHLARHVDQLRSLEGTWAFTHLETDGAAMPAAMFQASRLLIDGDRFRTESPGGNYEGIFNVNVEIDPHEIDIEFVEGPEAGNWNYGIFRLNNDTFELCLDLNGKPRPEKFGSTPGSGHAYETLKRVSIARPEDVRGGTPSAVAAVVVGNEDHTGFEFVESETLVKLQGDWTAVRIVRDGNELPSMMLCAALRTATKNEVKVSIGGRTMIHALVRMEETAAAVHVDYYNLGGIAKGTIQHGLFKWIGDEACFCMADPGISRPNNFTAPAGSGCTLSQWRPKE